MTSGDEVQCSFDVQYFDMDVKQWIAECEQSMLNMEFQCECCHCHVEAREFCSTDSFEQQLHKGTCLCSDCWEMYVPESWENGARYSLHVSFIEGLADFFVCQKCDACVEKICFDCC